MFPSDPRARLEKEPVAGAGMRLMASSLSVSITTTSGFAYGAKYTRPRLSVVAEPYLSPPTPAAPRLRVAAVSVAGSITNAVLTSNGAA